MLYEENDVEKPTDNKNEIPEDITPMYTEFSTITTVIKIICLKWRAIPNMTRNANSKVQADISFLISINDLYAYDYGDKTYICTYDDVSYCMTYWIY